MKQTRRTTLLVGRDSATRRARRLDVQSDVGELCFDLRSVRSRDHDSRSEQHPSGQHYRGGLGKPHLSRRRIKYLGTPRAMVGVYSSNNFKIAQIGRPEDGIFIT